MMPNVAMPGDTGGFPMPQHNPPAYPPYGTMKGSGSGYGPTNAYTNAQAIVKNKRKFFLTVEAGYHLKTIF